MRPLSILALEPYGALSHRLFLEGLRDHSRHRLDIAMLPGRKWKWRMRTAALHFAPLLANAERPDLLLVSDFLNLAELEALLPPERRGVPALAYFHENQLTYPLQGHESRDDHFALTHVHALLVARKALFNSAFHRESFLAELPRFLDLVPDIDLRWVLDEVTRRSHVMPLGTDLPAREPRLPSGRAPVILWSHRWEYDKNPAAFLEAVAALKAKGKAFRVRLLGERFRRAPPELEGLRELLGEDLLADGFLGDREAYRSALIDCDIVVSSAIHEFFGLGTLEAIRSGLLPVLPDDLAYPELLPPPERSVGRFLYRRDHGLAPTLERALEAVREGEWFEERRELVRFTEGFHWERLAPRYDRVFEEVAASGL
ncbi:MAG: DUF3524 domain-containing protein [Planctomycetota bacterium]